jgi:hypothetical protein
VNGLVLGSSVRDRGAQFGQWNRIGRAAFSLVEASHSQRRPRAHQPNCTLYADGVWAQFRDRAGRLRGGMPLDEAPHKKLPVPVRTFQNVVFCPDRPALVRRCRVQIFLATIGSGPPVSRWPGR